MQIVKLGPGQFALADLVHRRHVAGAPSVGELAPVDVKAFLLSPDLSFSYDGSAPIDYSAKGIEYERLYAGHAVLCAQGAEFAKPNRCSENYALKSASASHHVRSSTLNILLQTGNTIR